MVDLYLEHDTGRNFTLSPRDGMLLCILGIFSTSTYQAVAGDLVSIRRTTPGRGFVNVVNSLLALKPLYINMPKTREQCLA